MPDKAEAMIDHLIEYCKGHHGEQPSHVLLHSLTVDMPAMLETLRGAMESSVEGKALRMAMSNEVNNHLDAEGYSPYSTDTLVEMWMEKARERLAKTAKVRSYTCIECGCTFESNQEALQWLSPKCSDCDHDDKYAHYGTDGEEESNV